MRLRWVSSRSLCSEVLLIVGERHTSRAESRAPLGARLGSGGLGSVKGRPAQLGWSILYSKKTVVVLSIEYC